MASAINISNINILYPIAGQDNDTQGFRTNFTNIVSNFTTAANEITALQTAVGTAAKLTTVPLSPSGIGTPGQIAYDATHLYVCVASNTWVRAALSSW